jgi:hypothetical protein
MSAGLPPITDIARRGWHGRQVPQATRLLKRKASINHKTRPPNEAASLNAVVAGFGRRPSDGAGTVGNKLLLDFDDVPPYGFVCFVTLGREVRPGLRLVKCLCVAQAVPLDDGYTFGSHSPLYVFNPSGRGA